MIDIPDSIFPSNDQGQKICPSCKKILNECTCKVIPTKSPEQPTFTPKVRLEKKGRRGKSVTVVFGLSPEESYLKKLSRKLKEKVASGGTYYTADGMGVIEIQGNHLLSVQNFITDKNNKI